MTDKTSIEAKLAKATDRLQAASTAHTATLSTIYALQPRVNELDARLKSDPRLPQEVHVERRNATTQLNILKQATSVTQRRELDFAQAEVARLQAVLDGEKVLADCRQLWRDKSAAQVVAAKAAEAARDEVERLDAMLTQELTKTESAQKAQRTAILVRLGFSDEPAGKVSAAESALLGAAANVDALRAVRPGLEAKVAAADAKVAACDLETRQAERGILNAKYAIADGIALVALEACRSALLTCHAARLAATGEFGVREILYTQQEGQGWFEQEAERLKRLAAVGE